MSSSSAHVFASVALRMQLDEKSRRWKKPQPNSRVCIGSFAAACGGPALVGPRFPKFSKE
jgi:hypothetical protein